LIFVRWVPLAAAAYTAATLVRYYVSGGPRFPVESAFFIFVGVGVLAVLARRAGPDRLRQGYGGPPKPHAKAERPSLQDTGPALQAVALAALLIFATFLLYAPALQVGLLSDDFVIAAWAERFELVHFEATGFVRPGVPLFWRTLQTLPLDFGVTAHAANIILHGVNAALVSVIALRFGVRRPEAVAAGAMFAVFPGLSEAVVWLSGVQDVLMTTLALIAVVLATAADPKVMPAVATSVAALLVKETAIMIPLLSALVVAARDGVRPGRKQRIALASLAVVSVGYVLARAAAGVPSSFLDVGDWNYFVKQLVANAFAAVGAPWTDEWGRTHAGIALMRASAIVVLLAAAFFVWRRRDATFRVAAACAAWVLAAAVPAFSLFYVGPNLEGGRYVYLAAAGFTILLALLVGLAADRFRVVPRAVAIMLLTALLAAPFLPAIRSDLRRWQAAAGVRQDILGRVRAEADRAGCTTFAAEGEADSVAGAYIFRHGLAEALGLPEATSVVPCRVALKSGALTVERQ
jgi:hypothetical protein